MDQRNSEFIFSRDLNLSIQDFRRLVKQCYGYALAAFTGFRVHNALYTGTSDKGMA